MIVNNKNNNYSYEYNKNKTFDDRKLCFHNNVKLGILTKRSVGTIFMVLIIFALAMSFVLYNISDANAAIYPPVSFNVSGNVANIQWLTPGEKAFIISRDTSNFPDEDIYYGKVISFSGNTISLEGPELIFEYDVSGDDIGQQGHHNVWPIDDDTAVVMHSRYDLAESKPSPIYRLLEISEDNTISIIDEVIVDEEYIALRSGQLELEPGKIIAYGYYGEYAIIEVNGSELTIGTRYELAGYVFSDYVIGQLSSTDFLASGIIISDEINARILQLSEDVIQEGTTITLAISENNNFRSMSCVTSNLCIVTYNDGSDASYVQLLEVNNARTSITVLDTVAGISSLEGSYPASMANESSVVWIGYDNTVGTMEVSDDSIILTPIAEDTTCSILKAVSDDRVFCYKAEDNSFFIDVSVNDPAPIITSLISNDPDDLDNVYSNDDTITITFDSDTNTPGGAGVQSKTAVDNLYAFTHSLGESYAGQWNTADTFVITISNTAGAAPPIINYTIVTPTGITPILSSDETSDVSSATSPVLSGDFGYVIEPLLDWILGVLDAIYYNAGNVGIGTDNPTEQLHVDGNFMLDGNFKLNGNLTTDGDICIGKCQ